MDYYRRYTGDYLKKTLRLSMIEDGAYTRLLDYYYTEEGPLPPTLDEVYTIARANKAAEREAVRNVLTRHFELRDDGYHNDRADEELSVAVPKIEKLREVARENGKKGGNPKKKQLYNEPGALYAVRLDDGMIKVGITKHLPQRVSALRSKYGQQCSLMLAVQVVEMGRAEASILASFAAFADGEILMNMPPAETNRLRAEMLALGTRIQGRDSDPDSGGDSQPDPGPNPQPDPVHTRASQATVNRQPSTKPSTSDHRFPGDGDNPASPPKAVDAPIRPKPELRERVLEECRRAHLTDPTEANAIVMRWIANGATATLVINALAEARRTRPAPSELTAGYVDPIIVRMLRLEREAKAATDAKIERTTAIIAETRAAKDSATEMPEVLRKFMPKKPASVEE